MIRSTARIGSGIAIVMLLLVGAAHVIAQPGGTAAQLARHKEAMVARLLDGSPLAEEIGRSGNTEAQRGLEDARAHLSRARAALEEGNAKEANAELDAAMQATQRARHRMKGGDGASAAEMHGRVNALNSTLVALRAGYLARAEGGDAKADGKLRLIDALIADGLRQAAEGRPAEAIDSLRRAERMLSDAHEAAVGAVTLEYRKQFDSPDRIYEDELARNQSYVELLPIAIAQLRPPPAVADGLQRGAADNEAARTRAAAAAAAGRFDDATLMLQKATGALEALLQDAGLSLGRAIKE